MNNFTPSHFLLIRIALRHHWQLWAKIPSSYQIVCTMCTLFMFPSIFSDCWILTHIPHAYSRICVCLEEKRIRMRSALAWIECDSLYMWCFYRLWEHLRWQAAVAAAVVCLSNDKGNVSTLFKQPIQLPMEWVLEQFELEMCSWYS